MSLYSNSIDNIGIDDESIINVLKKLNLSGIFKDSTVTLDTEMTREFQENGIELSGGQIQLFSLSRLFIKDFNLLILDEPSSSLDPLTEYEVNKVLMEEFKNTTVIIIAHRLSTIREADCIYLLHNGKITESGNHDELMNKHGIYWDMFTKQAENYRK